MSSSESEDSENEENGAVGTPLEELTIEALTGRWMHSGGDRLTVVGAQVTFDHGMKLTLEQQGSKITLDGWHAVANKCSSDKIIWAKASEDKPCFWTFEGEVELADDGTATVDQEEIDTSNIITGKRRRGGTDYQALNKQLQAEEDRKKALLAIQHGRQAAYSGHNSDDDDDDFDADEAQHMKKWKRQKAASSSASSQPPPAAPKTPKVVIPPISLDELKRIVAQLAAGVKNAIGIESLSAATMKGILDKLVNFPMTLGILTETKIGKPLNKYRKHSDAKTGDRVLGLIRKWKGLL